MSKAVMPPGGKNIGKWLAKHWRDLRKLQGFGEAYFVDFANGDDTKDGETPENAKQTINSAMDLCVDEGHDYIFCKDFANASSFSTVLQTIDVKNVHVIGMEAFKNFNEYCGLYKGSAEDGPVVKILNNDVEVAGMALDSRWSTAVRTTGGSTHIQCLEVCGNDLGLGVGAYIHHCRFPAWYSKTGILISGSGYAEIEECTFEGYSTYAGLVFDTDGTNNPTFGRMKNLHSYNNKYTVEMISNGPRYYEIDGIMARHAGTAVVYVGANAATRAVIRGVVASNRTAAQLFAGGNGAAASIANLAANYGSVAADCWGSDGPLTA
jgi:hypothetical protein